MMVTLGPKHVASHTIKHDVFDDKYFIILVLTYQLLLTPFVLQYCYMPNLFLPTLHNYGIRLRLLAKIVSPTSKNQGTKAYKKLVPRNIYLLERPLFSVKKFTAFSETRKFITVFTKGTILRHKNSTR